MRLIIEASVNNYVDGEKAKENKENKYILRAIKDSTGAIVIKAEKKGLGSSFKKNAEDNIHKIYNYVTQATEWDIGALSDCDKFAEILAEKEVMYVEKKEERPAPITKRSVDERVRDTTQFLKDKLRNI